MICFSGKSAKRRYAAENFRERWLVNAGDDVVGGPMRDEDCIRRLRKGWEGKIKCCLSINRTWNNQNLCRHFRISRYLRICISNSSFVDLKSNEKFHQNYAASVMKENFTWNFPESTRSLEKILEVSICFRRATANCRAKFCKVSAFDFGKHSNYWSATTSGESSLLASLDCIF